MAEKEDLETSPALANGTSGFQDRPLAFRVTPPLKFRIRLDLHQHVTFATLTFEVRPLLFRRTYPT